MRGNLLLVLHTHLPYLKRAGEWPVGEEWLFQALGEAYLPVLDVLDGQAEKGRSGLLTLGLTPLIVHQLQDPGLLDRFRTWVAHAMLRCQMLADNAAQWPDTDARREAASFWYRHYRKILDGFEARGRQVLPSLRRLASEGTIEVLGGPLSHAYLPLHDDETVRAQLRLGLDEGERTLGTRPRGVWLPECAYRPGLEDVLAETGVEYCVLDGPTVLQAAGFGGTRHAWKLGDSPVACVGRDLEVSYRVWSPTGGYPGHGAYREYHRWEWETGLKLWRVTDKTVAQADKEFYDPSLVDVVLDEQVENFAALLRQSIVADGDCAVACYDTELFGHWWLEGPAWLAKLLDKLADDPVVPPTTLGSYVDRVGTAGTITPPAGSWGLRKDFSVWDNPETADMWQTLDDLRKRFLEALAGPPFLLAPGQERLLVQAARELYLAQTSDWPFMIGHDKSVEYAHERFDAHVGAAHRCLDALATLPAEPPAWLVELESDHDMAPSLTVKQLRAAHGC